MQIRTNKDGSKTQVVRQYGCNTTNAKDDNNGSSTFQQNSFMYINGNPVAVTEVDNHPVTSSSKSFPSLLPITATSPSSAASGLVGGSVVDHATLPRQSGTLSDNIQGCRTTATTMSSSSSNYRGHIVRLNSIDPNTVMFSTKDYPILGDITVPEIIDELEKQFEDKLCDLQGVRLVANNVYICLSRKESLQHLTTYGFYVRGVPVKVVDITNDSVVICLTGVPHYITDATITMLVSTFGISIGEVERRFYKGVDTGERFVRLKPRAHTQVPDFVTVGGCKILIRVLSQDEVCQPFTLQSATVETLPAPGTSSASVASATSQPLHSMQIPSTASASMTSQPKSRVKPGHCNGTLNSPTNSNNGDRDRDRSARNQTCSFAGSLFDNPTGSILTSSSRTEMIPTGVTGLLSSPLGADRTDHHSTGGGGGRSDNASTSSSPKIGKSLRSRLGSAIKSNPGADVKEIGGDTYVPGESLDIPGVSPPPYKAPSSGAGSTHSSITNGHHLGHRSSSNNNADSGSKSGGGGFASSLKKYAHKGMLSKTDSSNSLTSSTLAGKSTEAVRDGSNNAKAQRSSVVFDDSNGGGGKGKGVITPKTVNGILRKGSGPGDEIVEPMTKAERKAHRKSKEHGGRHKSKSRSSTKLESVTESGHEEDLADGSGGGGGGGVNDANSGGSGGSSGGKKKSGSGRGRSGSSSTKSALKEAKEKDKDKDKDGLSSKDLKAQKDLALTRDLPWCGCWGNGCL